MTRIFIYVAALMFVCTSFSFAQHAQEMHSDETVAQVPILTDFHEVIFKVWHTAWPEKNLAMLTELLPEITHFSDSLQKVQLPGILRDKEMAWTKNVAMLRDIVSDYASAATANDSLKLLDAAERLHAQYEGLVRVIRPVLKELDAFHQVLYMLYHHYLPDKNQENIASSVMELKEKMAELDKAVLPARLKKVESRFIDARKALSHSVQALDGSMAKSDAEKLASLVEAVHTDYQALEKVFE